MNHHRRLRVLLPALASLVAACGGSTSEVDGTSSSSSSSSGGASSSSSSSSSSSGGTTDETFATTVCTTGSGYEPMVGVTASAFDSLELVETTDNGADPEPRGQSLGVAGSPCATAADKPACTAAVAAFRAYGWRLQTTGFGPPQHRHAVTTKGDTVAGIEDPAALAAALAPIENEKDAALLVTATKENFFTCQGNDVTRTATGWDVKVHSGLACGPGTRELERIYAVTNDGTVTLKKETVFKEGESKCAIGRRPEGLAVHAAAPCDDPLGRFFAEAAHLEAASVYSFERLASELRALGAPSALVATAESSREDEIRHARMTSKMARRFGGTTTRPEVEAFSARSPLALALENATEGCVRETFGALVAHRQAARATDSAIQCMMHVIAEDETKHAALAWDVAAWLEPQLSADERELVHDARRRALADLRQELATEVHPDLSARAGMPAAADAVALLDALDERFVAAA